MLDIHYVTSTNTATITASSYYLLSNFYVPGTLCTCSLNTHSSPLGHFRDMGTEESITLPKFMQLEGNLGLSLGRKP